LSARHFNLFAYLCRGAHSQGSLPIELHRESLIEADLWGPPKVSQELSGIGAGVALIAISAFLHFDMGAAAG
jgi:hypothetical protein